jgi:heme/copper-type cytochrome/quinol oxidase subunit 2
MNYLTCLVAASINGKPVDIPEIPMSQLVTNGLNIVYFVVGIVAVVIIVIAGFQYLTSNGDPERAKRALHVIIDCAIGIAIVLFAFALTNFVAGRI